MKAPLSVEDSGTGQTMPLQRREALPEEAQAILAWLMERVWPRLAPGQWPAAWPEGSEPESFSEARPDQAEPGPGRLSRGEAQLLRLQERLLEAAARAGNRLLVRGSIVTRGPQSLLIIGDSAHEPLAVELSALDFAPVSIGLAAFEAGRPVPLPLLFALGGDDHAAIPDRAGSPEARLRPITAALYRLEEAVPAPEITHVLFPEARSGHPPLVRPISHAAARSRLFDSLLVAPEDPPAFAAVAALVRHTRAVAVPMSSVPQALESLARLLPRWQAERRTA